MTTQKYIKELESNLDCIENKLKIEIIKEIQSLITHVDDYQSLEKRLGKPSELAKNYLENSPKIIPIQKRVYTSLQKALAIMALIIISIIIISSIMISNFMNDPYDYSIYDSNSINEKLKTKWIKVNNVKNIKLHQSKIIFYASNEKDLSYSCVGEKQENNSKNLIIIKNNNFNDVDISQAKCIVKLPNNEINLTINQASVHLIEPQNTINIDSEQSAIRLATKQSKYNFKIEIKSSNFKNLISDKNGIKINAKLYQSSFEKYKY